MFKYIQHTFLDNTLPMVVLKKTDRDRDRQTDRDRQRQIDHTNLLMDGWTDRWTNFALSLQVITI